MARSASPHRLRGQHVFRSGPPGAQSWGSDRLPLPDWTSRAVVDRPIDAVPGLSELIVRRRSLGLWLSNRLSTGQVDRWAARRAAHHSAEESELATVGDSLLNGDRLVVKASALSASPLICVVRRSAAAEVTVPYAQRRG